MTSTFLRLIVLLAGIAALALGGWTVAGAHGGGCEHGHGHHAVGELIEALELRPDQQERLEEIHHLMASHHGHDPAAHMMALVEGVASGELDAASVRSTIDEHIETMRQGAYRFADTVIALIDSFDGNQREVLGAHLEKARERHGHHADHHG